MAQSDDRSISIETAKEIAKRRGLKGKAILDALVEAYETGCRDTGARRPLDGPSPRAGRKRYGHWADEKAALALALELRAAGKSFTEIADALNEKGFKRRSAGPWTRFSARAVVDSAGRDS